MMSFRKHNLFLFLSTIFLGASTPIFAMSPEGMGAQGLLAHVMQHGRKCTSEELTDFMGRSNLAMVNVSDCGKLPEALQTGYIGEFRGHEALFWAAQAGSGLAIFVDCAAMAGFTPTPGQTIRLDIGIGLRNREGAEQKHQVMVRAAGLKEVDPNSRAAQSFKRYMDELVSVFRGGDSEDVPDSDSGSEDSDAPGAATSLIKQPGRQKKALPAKKNSNCCGRLWARLHRIFGASSPAQQGGPKPTLGGMLNQLWD
jgi:hypothetical protein